MKGATLKQFLLSMRSYDYDIHLSICNTHGVELASEEYVNTCIITPESIEPLLDRTVVEWGLDSDNGTEMTFSFTVEMPEENN